VSSDYNGKPQNDYFRQRDNYYKRYSRSPSVHVNNASTSSASKIRNKFCPMHGQEAIFDRLIRNEYVYKCCGMVVPRAELGIKMEDMGIQTVDGKVSRNPIYGISDGSAGTIVPSGPSRSGKHRRKMPLNPDDAALVRQGYTLIASEEQVRPAKTIEPFGLDSSPVDLSKYDILDKFRRRRASGR
jgi:hypothetical protein